MLNFLSGKNKVRDLSWLGTDMHSHILPGLDQSVPDMETALLYVKSLIELGYQQLICTPPIKLHSPMAIQQAFLQLKRAIKEEQLEIEIKMSAEYWLDETFEAKEVLSPLQHNYVLISMPDTSPCSNLSQCIFDLVVHDYQPVLAHPERYSFLVKDKRRLYRLKEKGCLLQLNLLSVTGYYGKKVKNAALAILKENMYDLAGTDLQKLADLQALSTYTYTGKIFELIGAYPFKNKQIFH